MDRKEALRDLLAKVEAGEVLQAVDAVVAWPMCSDTKALPWLDSCKASQGDVNAALALRAAVLPKWLVDNLAENHDRRWWVSLLRPGEGDEDGNLTRHSAREATFDHADPARALLICILRALIAESDQC